MTIDDFEARQERLGWPCLDNLPNPLRKENHMIPGLTEGRIVHFILEDGPNKGHARAAMIVKVWDKETGCCNLAVFGDGINDGIQFAGGPIYRGSSLYSETPEHGTWHWTPKS
jgi:hypothetical protein